MTEIEWLEPGDSGDDAGADAPGHDDRRTRRLDVSIAVDALWIATGVLAFLAPFHAVYRYTQGPTSEAVDGWGRYSQSVGGLSGVHGTRFGILICVAAGVLAAGLILRRLARVSVWPFAVGTIATVLALGLVGACAGVMVLDFAALSNTAAIESANAVGQSRPDVQPGSGTWTLIAATAVGLAALAIDTVHRLRPAPGSGDELLATDPAGENL